MSHRFSPYSVATSACQVVQACIWNSVGQLAKAWPVNMRLEVRACERRGTVNMQQKASHCKHANSGVVRPLHELISCMFHGPLDFLNRLGKSIKKQNN